GSGIPATGRDPAGTRRRRPAVARPGERRGAAPAGGTRAGARAARASWCRRPRSRARGGAAGVELRWAEPVVGRPGRVLVGLRDGAEVALTPDGPRGPAERVKPGALAAAQHAAALVIAVGGRASSAWWLRSWDRFCLPKPFATIEVAYSAPFTVAAGKDGLRRGMADAERALAEVTYGGAER